MTTSFQTNSDRFLGLADIYDEARPRLPSSVTSLVSSYLCNRRPSFIVDLGCGTGLSTRPWAEGFPDATIVGVDPNPEMLACARARSRSESKIEYRQGFSHSTGIESSRADIVAISQAFHWMDPTSTLAEVARILRPDGGVLVVADCNWPPSIPGCWRSEKAFEQCRDNCDRIVSERNLAPKLQRWDKLGHLSSIRSKSPPSAFEWCREVHLHSQDEGTFKRLVMLCESQGGVKTAVKDGKVSRKDVGLEILEHVSEEEMGDQPRRWVWSYTLEIAFRGK